jgi:MOSC domain-containing protein YiiM
LQNRNAKVIALFIADTQSNSIGKAVITCDPQGIREDKHYGKDPARSVLVTSTYAYQLASDQGIGIPHGALGENILTDFDLKTVGPGERLQLGEVVLEIVQNCTLCNHLSKIDRKLPKLLRDDRGVFAKVVQGGTLHNGDAVSLKV